MKNYSFDYENFPKIDEDIVLCLGFFDGLHLGHQKIISEAKRRGKKIGVLSFDNSVYNFVNNSKELLTPRSKKINLLEEMNVDYFLEVKMSKALLKSSKNEFLNKLINLNPSLCVCGKDYTFGNNKEGTIEDLQKSFKTLVLDFEYYNGEKISSRTIFEALNNGDIALANSLLGRNYSISGTVEKGLQNGTRFGLPTANIKLNDFYFMPKCGVYVGFTFIDGVKYNSIATYGTHPTISELDMPILEILLLDFCGDIYDKTIDFEFIQFVRENKKFNNEEELITQINADKTAAIEFFLKKNS